MQYLDQSKLALLKQLTGQDRAEAGKKQFLTPKVKRSRATASPRCSAKKTKSLPLGEGKVSAKG
jgi:hypothetical protein